MLIARTRRHSRRSSIRGLATTAGIAGASLLLPLVGASVAAAEPSSHASTASGWGDAEFAHHKHQHHGHHHRRAGHAVAKASAASQPSPTSTPTTPATGTAATTQPGSSTDAVTQVLDLINKARAGQGLPAYTISTGLTLSAASHNQVMANGCGLSHQCPGEASIGSRESAQGVQWTSAGENIGEEGPVTSSAQEIATAAVSLTQDMLNEQPPNDGHRQNILSGSFQHIGIAVQRDAQGTVWLTQDFSN